MLLDSRRVSESGVILKKNLPSLVVIAAVVAIIATGIFYGLISGTLKNNTQAVPQEVIVVAARNLASGALLRSEDLKTASWSGTASMPGSFSAVENVAGATLIASVQENEPLTEARIASSKAGGGVSIPEGMRAVSVHVTDSTGIVNVLKPGHRVDVQVVSSRGGAEPELRTALQNMQVLSANTQPEQAAGRFPAPVVTLLATPAEADMLGIADSAARIRLLLRNPLDGAFSPAANISLAGLFQVPAARASRAPAVSHASSSGGIVLSVRLAAMDQAVSHELAPATAARTSGTMHVTALDSDSDLNATLRQLERGGRMRIYTQSRIETGPDGQASFRAGTRGRGTRLAIRFAVVSVDNGLRLRVGPEITAAVENGIATRRFETELELKDGQSFLVGGLAAPPETPALVAGLLPRGTHLATEERLVVIVSPTRKALHRAALMPIR
jgi:Flp pilus assembly protein CpaB